MAAENITSELAECLIDFNTVALKLTEADRALRYAQQEAANTEEEAHEIANRLNVLLQASGLLVRAVISYDDLEHICVHMAQNGERIFDNPDEFTATEIGLTCLAGISLFNRQTGEELSATGDNFKIGLELIEPEPPKNELTETQKRELLLNAKMAHIFNKVKKNTGRLDAELGYIRQDYAKRSLEELEQMVAASGISIEAVYNQ
jgi:hypothetical protein